MWMYTYRNKIINLDNVEAISIDEVAVGVYEIIASMKSGRCIGLCKYGDKESALIGMELLKNNTLAKHSEVIE